MDSQDPVNQNRGEGGLNEKRVAGPAGVGETPDSVPRRHLDVQVGQQTANSAPQQRAPADLCHGADLVLDVDDGEKEARCAGRSDFELARGLMSRAHTGRFLMENAGAGWAFGPIHKRGEENWVGVRPAAAKVYRIRAELPDIENLACPVKRHHRSCQNLDIR